MTLPASGHLAILSHRGADLERQDSDPPRVNRKQTRHIFIPPIPSLADLSDSLPPIRLAVPPFHYHHVVYLGRWWGILPWQTFSHTSAPIYDQRENTGDQI